MSDTQQEDGYESASTGVSDIENDTNFHEEGERDELKEVEKLAQRETRRVWIWKALLLLSILVAAALVTGGSYRILSEEEQDDFETTYDMFANTVKDGLQFHFSNFHLATSGMANAIAGAAVAYNQSFPFVTMPDFEVVGQSTRQQSGIEAISFAPYVHPDQKVQWAEYTHEQADWWTARSRATVLKASKGTLQISDYEEGPIALGIWRGSPFDPEEIETIEPDGDRTTFAPVWQQSPLFFANWVVGYDFMDSSVNRNAAAAMATLRHRVFSSVHDLSYISDSAITELDHDKFHKNLVDWKPENLNSTFELPHCMMTAPVFKAVNDPSSEIVGQLQGAVAWDYYLVGLLPEGAKGITAVLENTCNQSFTYELEGNSAFFRGAEDLHDPHYDHMKRTVPFYDFRDPVMAAETSGHCLYTFSLYPTSVFEKEHITNLPMVLSIVVGAAFLFMVTAFFMYDWFVQSRNKTVVAAAARATGIVSSMFPEQIRDQLLVEKEQEQKQQKKKSGDIFSLKHMNNGTVDEYSGKLNKEATKVIADFFPETTVMFADIVGFTAWSSVREPCQVFELLETLYAAFDQIARHRRIFKVETVGDCYVAVAGLPDPRKDHAVAMARFARDCLFRMQGLLKTLEVKLGPDTGDLTMRFGLNSGPVTAGVLRGQRSRFQLFGDTMNTASRMESTGRPNMIQVSHDTAELLKAAGKGVWLTPREQMTEVKGKGMMVTYWLNSTSSRDASSAAGSSTGMSSGGTGSSEEDVLKYDVRPGMLKSAGVMTDRDKARGAKTARLVQWNVEIVSNVLRQIQAQAAAHDEAAPVRPHSPTFGDGTGTVLDEVQEVISMPSFSEHLSPEEDSAELSDEIVDSLHGFISTIASLYRDNPFHNFEHASHVTMATVKLLSRVVNPKIDGVNGDGTDNASMLHDYTYGITSDPLTQLACLFSAIIHDIDHPGVPNTQLLKENARLAQVYKRSIAEQNSFDIAWDLFMDNRFAELRHAVCKRPDDLVRFRSLVVNLVMATDIMDKELNGFRNLRWERAFGAKANIEEAQKDKVDRKATIVIEHMIQASDVAHTMQHWHIYRKWNGRLFCEMYEAFLSGRSEVDPSTNWYQGEMGFFDFYIIPLAKKLAECGVFGVTSSEYLDYAMRNRSEWERRGQEVVAELLEEAKANYQDKIVERESTQPLLEETPGDVVQEEQG